MAVPSLGTEVLKPVIWGWEVPPIWFRKLRKEPDRNIVKPRSARIRIAIATTKRPINFLLQYLTASSFRCPDWFLSLSPKAIVFGNPNVPQYLNLAG
jgi:hypothetical protein